MFWKPAGMWEGWEQTQKASRRNQYPNWFLNIELTNERERGGRNFRLKEQKEVERISRGGSVLKKPQAPERGTWRWRVERDEARKAGEVRPGGPGRPNETMALILKAKTSYQMILRSFWWMTISSLEGGFKKTGKRPQEIKASQLNFHTPQWEQKVPSTMWCNIFNKPYKIWNKWHVHCSCVHVPSKQPGHLPVSPTPSKDSRGSMKRPHTWFRPWDTSVLLSALSKEVNVPSSSNQTDHNSQTHFPLPPGEAAN